MIITSINLIYTMITTIIYMIYFGVKVKLYNVGILHLCAIASKGSVFNASDIL